MERYFSSAVPADFPGVLLVPFRLVFLAVFLTALPAVFVADFFLAAMSLLTLET
jgi:hypothetical protein